MRIFVDAMGGDNAPQAPVEGTIEALRRFPSLEVDLAGVLSEVEPLLKDCDDVRGRIRLVDAPEVITNHDHPAMAVRRMKKSVSWGMREYGDSALCTLRTPPIPVSLPRAEIWDILQENISQSRTENCTVNTCSIRSGITPDRNPYIRMSSIRRTMSCSILSADSSPIITRKKVFGN